MLATNAEKLMELDNNARLEKRTFLRLHREARNTVNHPSSCQAPGDIGGRAGDMRGYGNFPRNALIFRDHAQTGQSGRRRSKNDDKQDLSDTCLGTT